MPIIPIPPNKSENLSDKEADLIQKLVQDELTDIPFELQYAKAMIEPLAALRGTNPKPPHSSEYHLSWLLRILYVAYIPFDLFTIRIMTRLYLAYTYNNLKRSPRVNISKNSSYYRIADQHVFNAMLEVAKNFYNVHKHSISCTELMHYNMAERALNSGLHLTVSIKCAATFVRPENLTLESFSKGLKERVPLFKKDKSGYYFPNLSRENLKEYADL